MSRENSYAPLDSAGQVPLDRLGNAVSPDVQVFTTGTGTWTKPTGATFVRVQVYGPGGAGGSGRRGASSSARCGGGAGGGGGYSEATFLASELPATVNVTIPTPPTGGAAVTADDTNGDNGAWNSIAYFGASSAAAYVSASSGNRGIGGTTAAAVTGGTGGPGVLAGDSGASGTTSTGTAKTFVSGVPTRGGGGGAGMLAGGDVEAAGGTGFWPSISYAQTSPANGGAVHTDGGPGVSSGFGTVPGASGGGGGSSNGAVGGNGGAGTAIGAGGGGGGASTNGFASGAGGDGGPGAVIVTSW